MTPAEALRRARGLIAEPDRWCAGVRAMDEQGDGLEDAGSADAVAWCMGGALESVGGAGSEGALDWLTEAAVQARLALGERFDGHGYEDDPIAEFNDAWSTVHKDVLAVYDRAISLAEGGPPPPDPPPAAVGA